MGKTTLFGGGVPTAPDVRKLREQYGIPEEGWSVSHDEVASIIGCSRLSFRYRTVTSTWRRGLYKETGGACYIGVSEGRFLVLKPQERVDTAWAKAKSGFRALRRVVGLVDTTDRARLSPEGRRQADHVQLISSKSLLHGQELSRKEALKLPEAVAKN